MAKRHRPNCSDFSQSRREFLVTSCGAALSTVVDQLPLLGSSSSQHGVRFTLFRSRDLLKFELFSEGLRLNRKTLSNKLTLRPVVPGSAPNVQLNFGPQHLLEEAIPEDTSGSVLRRRGELSARPAAPTVLTFRWPSGLRELLVDEKELLKIFEFESVFQGNGSNIEPVTGLSLSPASPKETRWIANGSESRDGVNPLWTVELAPSSKPLRMWVTGWKPTGDEFISPETDLDRKDIFETFSGSVPKCVKHAADAVIPAPQVNQLVLSSQGAWFDVRAAWDPIADCSFAEWSETVTQRRTHFAEQVFKAWLYPDGIPVLLVLQSTRELEAYDGEDFGDGVGAYLKKRLIIRAREDSKLTSAADLFESPFTEVVVPSEGIPMLDIDKKLGNLPALPSGTDHFIIGGVPRKGLRLGDIAFWPLVGGKPLKFKLSVKDNSGISREVVRSFIVVGNGLLDPDSPGNQLKKTAGLDYEKILDDEWESHPERHVDMGAIPWAIAKERLPGDTSLTVREIDVVRAASRGPNRPFFSRTHSVGSILDVSRALTGSPTVSRFTYRKKYLPVPSDARADTAGLLDPEVAPGGAFVRVFDDQSAKLEVARGSQRSLGGITSPNSNVGGVGRDHGLVLGHPDLPATPSLDQIFPQTAQLVGGFLIKDLLSDVGEIPGWNFEIGIPPIAPTSGPSSSSDEEPAVDGWIASFTWSTDKVKSSGFFGSDGAELTVLADVGSRFSDGKAFWHSKGLLTNFFIAFPSYDKPMFQIDVDELRFEAGTGESPQITCRVKGVKFQGLLALLEKLRELLKIPAGLHVDVSANAIGVSYEIKKEEPSEIFGILTISDLKLRTGLSLPLTGDPLEVTLAVSGRDQPFTISSTNGYAGAGYLEVRAHSDGIFFFAFSIELGASWKKDFGIAKGGVTLMAGFYFEKNGKGVGFRAYVRLQGFLNVAGIGGVDITAHIALSWADQCPNTFQGECEVKVTVHIGPLEVSQSFKASHSIGADCHAPLSASVLQSLSLEEFCEVCP
jgi:hypothetical protein